MSRIKELARERLKPAKELYVPDRDPPTRPGAEQHRLYKSTGYRINHEKLPSRPGKWSPVG